jgi:hypothetical protein
LKTPLNDSVAAGNYAIARAGEAEKIKGRFTGRSLEATRQNASYSREEAFSPARWRCLRILRVAM